jgi:hypothetical protein
LVIFQRGIVFIGIIRYGLAVLFYFIRVFYRMKFQSVYIAIILVLVVIIFITTSTGSTYVPYSKTSYFDQAFPYEGMSTIGPVETPLAGNVVTSPVVAGNTAPASGNILGNYMTWMSKLLPTTDDISSKSSVAKVEGFALQPSPYNEPEVIDRYGNTPGEPSCFGKSMGYSRSTGPLCFTEEDLKLLTTRGGNMSGRDSVIGQPM